MLDVSEFTGVCFTGDQDDMSHDATVRGMTKAADTTLYTDKRLKLYADALKMIAEKECLMPMFSYPANYAFNSDLVFAGQPDELPRFYLAKWK